MGVAVGGGAVAIPVGATIAIGAGAGTAIGGAIEHGRWLEGRWPENQPPPPTRTRFAHCSEALPPPTRNEPGRDGRIPQPCHRFDLIRDSIRVIVREQLLDTKHLPPSAGFLWVIHHRVSPVEDETDQCSAPVRR